MNVILATPTWSLNGPNVFSANLVRSLNGKGLSAHILITRPDWEDPKPLPRPTDVPLRDLPLNRFLSGRFLSADRRWQAMLRYLEIHAPCIYLPNHDFGHSCISPALSDGVAICGIVHSDDPQHYEHVGRLGRYWDSVVAVSETIGDRIERQFPSIAPRLSIIPYGVSVPGAPLFHPPSARHALRAIYAGRLEQPQKRVLDLPPIMRAAAELGVPVELTIAGGGPEEEALRTAFRETGCGSKVEFVGILNAGRLGEAYAAHDVFLLTSAFEGMPLSMLEAMGHGCVPVVTDLPSGISETIRHGVNGFRCEMADAASYARCLRTLHNAPKVRGEMALRAWETVDARFRLETMADRYVSLFETLPSKRFIRPAGPIKRSPSMPRAELLPGPLQMLGHCVNSLARFRRR